MTSRLNKSRVGQLLELLSCTVSGAFQQIFKAAIVEQIYEIQPSSHPQSQPLRSVVGPDTTVALPSLTQRASASLGIAPSSVLLFPQSAPIAPSSPYVPWVHQPENPEDRVQTSRIKSEVGGTESARPPQIQISQEIPISKLQHSIPSGGKASLASVQEAVPLSSTDAPSVPVLSKSQNSAPVEEPAPVRIRQLQQKPSQLPQTVMFEDFSSHLVYHTPEEQAFSVAPLLVPSDFFTVQPNSNETHSPSQSRSVPLLPAHFVELEAWPSKAPIAGEQALCVAPFLIPSNFDTVRPISIPIHSPRQSQAVHTQDAPPLVL